SPFWHVRESRGRAWLDLQNDVTVKDVVQAHREGFRSVEHLKRYTTLGMATDQGKTANVGALAVMAEQTGKTVAETGTTVFRPPYTPVPIAAFAGRARGRDFQPTRLTPSHDWAAARGAVFIEAGLWLRAQWFPRPGETHWRQSVDREVLQTRASVGICDVTTLGKIDIQGRDAAEFLNRVYANGFAKLAVGKVRYGLMLREDGICYDDGTTARLGETHFVMTTTTANAVLVFRNLEFARQCLWPGLDVHLISVTEQWAQFAVAGPYSRELLGRIVDPHHDISNKAFPFMACAEVSVCGGTPARLFRISFSGELAYEVAVPARYGESLMGALLAAGEDYGAVAYGTEALGVMRVEKGHAAGPELNGQTTARMLGMERMVSKKKDCIGNVLSERPEMNREDGLELMGFRPLDRAEELAPGAHFLAPGAAPTMANDEGWMSSVAWSPSLGHSIGLGFIRNGHARIGETVRAWDAVRGRDVPVEIVSAHFLDPRGERLRG
ncbi:MAG: sarcosine oxidase subunit alpha, partial [Rhodospirillaceae bacterium]|nr:sarcosine oxidase subunit alpha [Rhodospirillaceae bacterium]